MTWIKKGLEIILGIAWDLLPLLARSSGVAILYYNHATVVNNLKIYYYLELYWIYGSFARCLKVPLIKEISTGIVILGGFDLHRGMFEYITSRSTIT